MRILKLQFVTLSIKAQNLANRFQSRPNIHTQSLRTATFVRTLPSTKKKFSFSEQYIFSKSSERLL